MEFIRQLIEISPNPVYVRDEQGRYVYMNEAYAQLHGQNISGIKEKGEVDLDFAYDKDLFILKSNEPTTLEELYQLTNGQKIWFQTTKKPFVGVNGTRYLLSTLTDITNLKEKQLPTSEEIKTASVFLANLSKEFEVDINVIKSMAGLLKKKPNPAKQGEYLQIIESVAGDLLEVPSNALELSKLETETIQFKSFPFDVTSILHYTLHTLTAKAEEQNILLNFKEPLAPIPLVLGDPNRLNQVLVNLITLFIKNTLKGPVTVTAGLKERLGNLVYLEFSVENTEGIIGTEKIKHYLENLSDTGQNFDLPLTNADLKLRICKKILEIQQGRIWLNSKPKGGSQINFIIPFPLSEKALLADGQKILETPSQLKGKQILLAEDNPANQLLVVSQLKNWEAEIDVAPDGKVAWEKAKKRKYDLILMDIDMPVMNGFEATAKIRKESNPNQNTPLNAFTANATKIDVNRYKEFGFSDYFFKPYPEANLY
ncbi:MAG: response regulator, partial [Bacteroidota bacterium]|nr:response regulator [Bacteroidota bacterium]